MGERGRRGVIWEAEEGWGAMERHWERRGWNRWEKGWKMRGRVLTYIRVGD